MGGKEILFQSGPGNNWMVDVCVDSVKYCEDIIEILFFSPT